MLLISVNCLRLKDAKAASHWVIAAGLQPPSLSVRCGILCIRTTRVPTLLREHGLRV
jgi:hypothetical protein